MARFLCLTLALVLLVTLTLPHGEAVQCYECNSEKTNGCPNWGFSSVGDGVELYDRGADSSDESQEYFCTKSVKKDLLLDGHVTVVRSYKNVDAGTVQEGCKTDERGGQQKVTNCFCKAEMCNLATSNTRAYTITIATVLLVSYWLFH